MFTRVALACWRSPHCRCCRVFPQGAGPQQAESFERKITKTVSGKYLLYLRRTTSRTAEPHAAPVVLHGAGERGDDLEL